MQVIGNLLSYMCAKNYENRRSLGKATSNIKHCSFCITRQFDSIYTKLTITRTAYLCPNIFASQAKKMAKI